MSVYKVYKKTEDGVELVKIPIDNIDLSDLPTVKAVLKDADEVGGTTVEDISRIDTWADSAANLGYLGNEDGIAWDDLAEVFSEKGNHTFEIAHRIPLSAGNDIEFVNEGHTISINSTVEVPKSTSQLTNDSDFTTNKKLNDFKDEYNAHKHTVTPSGSVSSTFSGDSLTSTGTYKPSGEVSSTFTGTTMTSTGTFTPEGTISTVSHKPSGSVTVSATTSATGNYTPVGSVSKPTISVSPSFSTVLASGAIKGTFADGGLTLSLSTTTDDVVKSATASLDSTPTFTGTKVNISASFSGDSFSVTPTFTGTSGSVSVSGTTAGSVGSTFSGTSANISVSGTPSGTITSEFEGTSLQTTSTPV